MNVRLETVAMVSMAVSFLLLVVIAALALMTVKKSQESVTAFSDFYITNMTSEYVETQENNGQ